MLFNIIRQVFGLKKGYTMKEVRKNNYIVVNDQVIDVSFLLKRHPGGVNVLKYYAGKDASIKFNKIHKLETHKALKKYVIGYLKKECECKQCKCKKDCSMCICKKCKCKSDKKQCVCIPCNCQKYKKLTNYDV